jgi:hypothetical protein
LSTRGTVLVPNASAAIAWAPPIRNKRVTPASSAAAMTAGSGRGQTATDFADAGDTRRDRGHQQRRRQGKAAAGDVAADRASGSTRCSTDTPGLITMSKCLGI